MTDDDDNMLKWDSKSGVSMSDTLAEWFTRRHRRTAFGIRKEADNTATAFIHAGDSVAFSDFLDYLSTEVDALRGAVTVLATEVDRLAVGRR